MISLYIVGTHHKHQFGLCNVFNRNDQACEVFADYLKSQCIGFGIKTLAEEMCSDARLKWAISRTVPESVALDLRIDHSDCDPNEEERRLLGIVNEGVVKINGFFHNQTAETIQENIRREYDKRECEWVHRISQLPHSPVLFICGSEHSSSLMEKAKNHGFHTYMIVEKWTPEYMTTRNK
jgi:hypothetical protein